jgi:hypothetical protein
MQELRKERGKNIVVISISYKKPGQKWVIKYHFFKKFSSILVAKFYIVRKIRVQGRQIKA